MQSFQAVVSGQHAFSRGRITELPFLDSKFVWQVKEFFWQVLRNMTPVFQGAISPDFTND